MTAVRFWVNFKDHTISQLPLLTASSTSSPIIAAATLILFKCSTWSFMMAINGVTTTIVNVILSCLHSNARFIRGKSWKTSLFPQPVGEIVKTSILPTTCFKQFLCSLRLSSTFGKSLSAVFVASSNSGRDVESFLASCDRRRSTVDKNCQNQPIRGYTRIWYTGTRFC